MPYIAVKADKQETEHRELKGSMVVGRAPDCDIQIRDILLSRHHCKLEESETGWRVTDLNSKNGTAVNGQTLLEPVDLKDNDVMRMGRCVVVFHAAKMEASLKKRPSAPLRPADPSEALAGTLAGFTLLMPGEGEEPPANQPSPQPRPREPVSYERPEIRELLHTIASSSWDSIYAKASKQHAMSAEAAAEGKDHSNGNGNGSWSDDPPRRRARPKSPVDETPEAPAVKRGGNGRKDRGDDTTLHVSQADISPEISEASTIKLVPTTAVGSLNEAPAEPRGRTPRMHTPRIHMPRFSRKAVMRSISWAALLIWVALVATLFTWWTTHADSAAANPTGPSAVPIVQPAQVPAAQSPAADAFDAWRNRINAQQISPAVQVAAMNAPELFW